MDFYEHWRWNFFQYFATAKGNFLEMEFLAREIMELKYKMDSLRTVVLCKWKRSNWIIREWIWRLMALFIFYKKIHVTMRLWQINKDSLVTLADSKSLDLLQSTKMILLHYLQDTILLF